MGNLHCIILSDVDPVARMKSFRALKRVDPNGIFSHPKTLKFGEFQGPKTLQIGEFSHPKI